MASSLYPLPDCKRATKVEMKIQRERLTCIPRTLQNTLQNWEMNCGLLSETMSTGSLCRRNICQDRISSNSLEEGSSMSGTRFLHETPWTSMFRNHEKENTAISFLGRGSWHCGDIWTQAGSFHTGKLQGPPCQRNRPPDLTPVLWLSLLLSVFLPLHLLALLWIKAGQGASHHRAQCQTERVDVRGCQSSTGSQEMERVGGGRYQGSELATTAQPNIGFAYCKNVTSQGKCVFQLLCRVS